MGWRSLAVLAVIVSFAAVFTEYQNVSALSTCVNTEVIGVRGSGQTYGHSKELLAVKDLLPAAYKFTELESGIPGLETENAYLSIAVADDNFLNISGVNTTINRSTFGYYRKSVDSGKNLLKKYLESFKSSNTCLVLVGYSQGAQVVNETMRDMHAANPSSVSNVIYIGLFGDPLYSPLGFNLPDKPAWLRGDALYPFYGSLFKDVATPTTQAPDYIPRNPANPKAPFTKIGSWCNYGDVVCATDVTHFAAMRDGHATYTTDSAREMVDEIRAAIATPDQNITGALWPTSTCGAAKQDLVVLLDTSAYMRRNRDLFTKEHNMWDTKVVANQKVFRTFGEQLLDSGCGDTRVALVGFEGPSGQPPRLLQDFTSHAADIDNLMDSLYQPSSGGYAERPQVREAAILGMQQDWRPDASHTLFALTPMAGSGVVNAGSRDIWSSPNVTDQYMSDEVGQQFIALSRKTSAAILATPYLPIDMTGFTLDPGYPGGSDTSSYFQSLAKLTGGYIWEKLFITYAPRPNVRNLNFAEEIRQFETRRDGTRVTMKSVRAKVGQPVTLELTDSANLLASARVRGHGTATQWYLNCDGLQKETKYPVIKTEADKVTFTPTKAGTCTAAVKVWVQGSGNGCYWGCPEPFPPYMLRTISFQLDVRPADYDDKVPGDITGMTKTIYDTHVDLNWDPAPYVGNNIVYLIRDDDGTVLGATKSRMATISDTAGQDADVGVQAIGDDGRSKIFSSSDDSVQILDVRTPPPSEAKLPVTDTPSLKPSVLSEGAPSSASQTSMPSNTSATFVPGTQPEPSADAVVILSPSAQVNDEPHNVLGEAVVRAASPPAITNVFQKQASTSNPSVHWKWLVVLAVLAGGFVGMYRWTSKRR